MPSKMKAAIHIAEITGPYVFDPKPEDPYYHYRTVKWIETDIPRPNFAPDVLMAFRAQRTIYKIQRHDAESRVRAMATSGWKSAGGLPPPKVKDEGDSPHSNTGSGLVEWENIAEAAACIFNVWSKQQPELEWAKSAWQHLREYGLTRYSTDVDRHVVQCRLLALGGIYQDFCQRAFDVSGNKDYQSLAEDMELDEFTLGRLYQDLDNGSTNDDVGMYDAMESIVEAQRPAVVAAIQDGFGDEEDLIRSLWNCCMMGDFDSDEDGDEIVPEAGMSMPKLKALDWIMGGCEPLP